MSNLTAIKEKIKNISDYSPQLAAYNDQLDDLINDAYYSIWTMRRWVYGFKEYSIEQTTMNPENLAIIIGAKMRSDSLFKLPMKFKNGVFSDYDSAPGQASASQSITVNGQTFTSEGEGNSIAQTMNGHRPGKDEDIPF